MKISALALQEESGEMVQLKKKKDGVLEENKTVTVAPVSTSENAELFKIIKPRTHTDTDGNYLSKVMRTLI